MLEASDMKSCGGCWSRSQNLDLGFFFKYFIKLMLNLNKHYCVEGVWIFRTAVSIVRTAFAKHLALQSVIFPIECLGHLSPSSIKF